MELIRKSLLVRRRRINVQFLTHLGLASLRKEAISNEGAESEWVELLEGADVFVLDDLGAARLSEFAAEATFEVIDTFYSDCRTLIITTNLGLDALKEYLGHRVVSRLAEMCLPITLEGADRRWRAWQRA